MSNEGKTCDAVLKVLEARTDDVRRDVSQPEKEHLDPPVELRLKLGTQDFGIEHTLLEPFEGQIGGDNKFAQFIKPIIEELSKSLPKPGVYYLRFPVEIDLNVKKKNLPEVQAGFIDWVCNHSAAFHAEYPKKPTRQEAPSGIEQSVTGRPPRFPYDVTLHRELHWNQSEKHDGVLLPSRVLSQDQDLETLRAKRLQRALADKCPKLKRCKEEGARTVLILEDNDMFLTNYALIQDAFTSLLDSTDDLPDEIFLVGTSMRKWDVRTLFCDGQVGPVEDRSDFDSSGLSDITNSAK